jgi:ADP-ribose pyrophosphatase
VIPLDGDDLLLVRQFRSPAGRALLEIPAGTLDRRPDGSVEPPDEAAPRELAEETGHRAARWRRLGTFWTAPGFASEAMTLYLATELTAIDGYEGPRRRAPRPRAPPLARGLALAEAGPYRGREVAGGHLLAGAARGARRPLRNPLDERDAQPRRSRALW